MPRTPKPAAPTTVPPLTASEKLELRQLRLRKLRAQAERAELLLERQRQETAEQQASAAQNNTYIFFGDVTEESIKDCLMEISAWARKEPQCAITIILNSDGGVVKDGLALYDYLIGLRNLGHEVTIVALGDAASMAGVLLQAASKGKRKLGINTRVLIHQISYTVEGKSPDHRTGLANVNEMEKSLLKILAQRSTLTIRQIRNMWDRKDVWFGAQKAIELGFADEIF